MRVSRRFARTGDRRLRDAELTGHVDLAPAAAEAVEETFHFPRGLVEMVEFLSPAGQRPVSGTLLPPPEVAAPASDDAPRFKDFANRSSPDSPLMMSTCVCCASAFIGAASTNSIITQSRRE